MARCVSDAVCINTRIFSLPQSGGSKHATHAMAQYNAAVVHMQDPSAKVLCEGYTVIYGSAVTVIYFGFTALPFARTRRVGVKFVYTDTSCCAMADLLFTLKLQLASLDQQSGPLFTKACLHVAGHAQPSSEERVRVGCSIWVDSSERQRQRAGTVF